MQLAYKFSPGTQVKPSFPFARPNPEPAAKQELRKWPGKNLWIEIPRHFVQQSRATRCYPVRYRMLFQRVQMSNQSGPKNVGVSSEPLNRRPRGAQSQLQSLLYARRHSKMSNVGPQAAKIVTPKNPKLAQSHQHTRPLIMNASPFWMAFSSCQRECSWRAKNFPTRK